MGVKAITWAFSQPVSGNGKVVLLALADHADDDGKCWPSIPLVAQKACISVRTVQRVLITLESDGLVKRVHRTGDDGRNAANLYVLSIDGVNLSPGDGDSSVTGDGDSIATGDGDNCVTTLKRTINKNHQKEPSNILVGASVESEFEEFWQAYPKRSPHPNPKHPAKLKYVNARKAHNVPHETMMTAVKAYAASVAKKDREMIAQAQTWLNQRRWEEDCPVAEAPSASDTDLDAIVAKYPGVVSDRATARKALAAELSKGVALDDIVKAAEKFKLYIKQAQQSGTLMAAPILETWIKFKWREMDAYYIYRNPVERYPVLKPVKVKT